MTELAVTVGLHKSTVHRILATFCEHGLADRVDDHRYTALDGLAALRGVRRNAGPDPSSPADRAWAIGSAGWSSSRRPLPKTAGDRAAGAPCRWPAVRR